MKCMIANCSSAAIVLVEDYLAPDVLELCAMHSEKYRSGKLNPLRFEIVSRCIDPATYCGTCGNDASTYSMPVGSWTYRCQGCERSLQDLSDVDYNVKLDLSFFSTASMRSYRMLPVQCDNDFCVTTYVSDFTNTSEFEELRRIFNHYFVLVFASSSHMNQKLSECLEEND